MKRKVDPITIAAVTTIWRRSFKCPEARAVWAGIVRKKPLRMNQ